MQLIIFKNILETFKQQIEHSIIINELGIDISQYSDNYNEIIDELLKDIYGEYGHYIICNWLITEPNSKFIEDEYDLTDIESLWQFLEFYKQSDDFIPYTEPPSKPYETNINLN